MLELQSCKIIKRETENVDRIFDINSATYESTFVDENNEEYVYTSELILVNKVPSLFDCVSNAVKMFYTNKDNVHRKKMTFIEIGSLIYSRYFDLYINGTLYKRALSTKDLTDLSYVYSMLKKHNFFVYDVMQSLTSPSEYDLLIAREYKQ